MMKTTIKAMIILGMITGFWYILPLIFGGIALHKINRGQTGAGTGVCEILFGGHVFGIVAGILMLMATDSEYSSWLRSDDAEQATADAAATAADAA
ncbi:MAG: hypothetical protein LUD50_07085 [Clostridia bacterium]|nr:hypothetical protein [Clostridia bacterium]